MGNNDRRIANLEKKMDSLRGILFCLWVFAISWIVGILVQDIGSDCITVGDCFASASTPECQLGLIIGIVLRGLSLVGVVGSLIVGFILSKD